MSSSPACVCDNHVSLAISQNAVTKCQDGPSEDPDIRLLEITPLATLNCCPIPTSLLSAFPTCDPRVVAIDVNGMQDLFVPDRHAGCATVMYSHWYSEDARPQTLKMLEIAIFRTCAAPVSFHHRDRDQDSSTLA